MRSVELFAGAGGLAIGMGRAGFKHDAVIEWNHNACETFRFNQQNHAHDVDRWPVFEGDARAFDYSTIGGEVVVVSGGPLASLFLWVGSTAATWMNEICSHRRSALYASYGLRRSSSKM